MKLQRDTLLGQNIVTGYGPGYVTINQRRHETSLILLPDRILESWAASGFKALAETDFQVLSALEPEIVLLGTGARLRFPPVHLLRPLIEAGIGYEVMDLQAACRTYNILTAEGRRVAAALLID